MDLFHAHCMCLADQLSAALISLAALAMYLSISHFSYVLTFNLNR